MIRLVVLRPEPGAAATAARAEALGFATIVAPLFAVTPLPWRPPEEPVDAVMMTSANAARHGGPGLARYRALPLHAVGPETAAAARDAGFVDIRIGPGDAAALAAALGDAGRVLHLAGREHRPDLPSGGLRRVVYAADPVPALPETARAALAGGATALLHSARAAALFAALVDAAGLDRAALPLAALSRAVAEAAGMGWRRMIVAPAPEDGALLRAIGATGD